MIPIFFSEPSSQERPIPRNDIFNSHDWLRTRDGKVCHETVTFADERILKTEKFVSFLLGKSWICRSKPAERLTSRDPETRKWTGTDESP